MASQYSGIPDAVVKRLLPNETVQFTLISKACGYYFTNKRVIYQGSSAARIAKSNNFSLLEVGLSFLTNAQDYNDIPYKNIQNVMIDGSYKVKVHLYSGNNLEILCRDSNSALQAQQFLMSKIL